MVRKVMCYSINISFCRSYIQSRSYRASSYLHVLAILLETKVISLQLSLQHTVCFSPPPRDMRWIFSDPTQVVSARLTHVTVSLYLERKGQ